VKKATDKLEADDAVLQGVQSFYRAYYEMRKSLKGWRKMAPFKDPALVERDLAALRKAGLK
jgi:hypothetical protein